MKLLRVKPEEFKYADDVERIVGICKDRGYTISPSDAQTAWEKFSDSYAAGWLILGEDSEVFSDIMGQCEVLNFDHED